MSCALEDL
uniref:Uncharacterized protein n=1 Tax=Anguilla anguilla TaxID=7936 RepID=A0A0E9U1W0_ANGAN